MKKVIRLTESDLVRIVKRVISEQPSSSELNTMVSGKKNTTKPGPNGKYCFSDSDLMREIKNTGNHNIKLYRIKQGDTLSHIYEMIDQKESLKTMNPQCDLKSKNGFRVGDVIMMSLLPGS